MRSRKAVELSVNFLVIIILSLVIMSLGIIIMRQFISSAEEMREQVNARTKQTINDVLSQGKPVVIPINRKTIQRGDWDIFDLKITNTGDSASFQVVVSFDEASDKDNIAISTGLNLLYISDVFTLERDESKPSYAIGVEVPKDAASGTYVFNVCVYKTSTSTTTCDPSSTELYNSPIKKFWVQVP